MSYKLWVEDESPYGEIERQYWPYTPFEVMVTSHNPEIEYFQAKVRIDGLEASLKYSKGSVLIKGFQGSMGSNANTREFCFSPPRPAKKRRTGEQDRNDKIAAERLCDLGSIVVTIRKSKLTHTEEIMQKTRSVNYAEANKEVYLLFRFQLLLSIAFEPETSTGLQNRRIDCCCQVTDIYGSLHAVSNHVLDVAAPDGPCRARVGPGFVE